MTIEVSESSVVDRFPGTYLERPVVRDLPDPPRATWRIIGPGIVGAGIALGSGEFLLFPYIASQVGLVFVWAAVVGVVTQWFINMEIERYTLATGETALTGFSRFWSHAGLFFAIMIYIANLWPGWATSSAAMTTFLVGGNSAWISVGMMLSIGVILTLSPVAYTALEKVEMGKIVLVGILVVVGLGFAIDADTWRDVPRIVTDAGAPTEQLGFALLLGALAFAGLGGGGNLCQSNWIRDKGFGMGSYVPKIVSPITGKPEARGAAGFIFLPTEANLSRWRAWWRFANVEQAMTFLLMTLLTIVFTSLLAYSAVFGEPGLKNDISFVRLEGERHSAAVGDWFGTVFLIVGAIALYGSAIGIVDYTSRIGADVLNTSYLRKTDESRIYFWLVWGLVVLGCAIVLSGLNQPIVLLVISACIGGFMMFIYSALLIVLNYRVLPKAIRISALRIFVLGWATALFGILSVFTFAEQIPKLF